jgi:PAS domain S-box-containing protein
MPLSALRLSSRWISRPLILGIAVPLTLLAAAGVPGLRYWHARQAAYQSVEQSRHVIGTLDRLRLNLSDLEGRRRRYLLTLDPAYLKPDGESVRAEVEALQTLVADDPSQSPRAANLALTVSAALSKMDEIVKTPPESGRELALAIVVSMEAIRWQIDWMTAYQRYLLVRWQLRADALERSTTWLIAVAVVIASVCAGAALALALLEARRRRKATEENVQLHSDLEEREAKIRRLFDSNIIGVVIFDFEGRFIDANDAFLDMVGHDREDLVSGRMRWTEMTPAEWRAAGEQALASLRATPTRHAFEQEYFRKDGSRVPVLVGAVALEGRREEGVAFVLDLTERKRAEYLTRQVFESSADSISIVGRDYRYRRVNPAFERKYGRPLETFVGKHVTDVLEKEGFEQTAKPYYERCFAGEEVSYAEWFTLSIGRRYLAVTYSPLRPTSERVEAVLVISHDLTEHVLASEALRKAEMELAHANRLTTMGQLTASIAHDVKQPIAATVTNADAALRWLDAQPPDLAEVRHAIARIANDGKRAGDVIQRIRSLSKKVPARTDRFDINDAIIDVVALTRSELSSNGVSLQTQFAQDLPLIQGDRVQLQQVMLNLIVNAIEAMSGVSESARKLWISTETDASNGTLVAVRDSGRGFDSASLEQLFDAFYTTKSSGMGMGLSICHSIIEAHGGRIWAEANLPQGAAFQFTLPRPAAT